jgi:hypothetical protein
MVEPMLYGMKRLNESLSYGLLLITQTIPQFMKVGPCQALRVCTTSP